MKFELPQIYFSKIMRAIVEFDLIQDNDRILIGLSGGKDSLLLTYAMAMMRERLKKKFSLGALTINPMFSDDFDTARLSDFCRSLDIPFESFDVDINDIIKNHPEKSPCFSCAFFRRGSINRYALEHNFNKIAYAHHHDDAVETLLMGLFYSGQVQTFTPKTYLDRTGLTVIRPLIYLREYETREAVKYHKVQPVPSPCPHDGKTTRQTIKELIAALSKDNPALYDHLASAMRKNNVGELWPASKTRKEMADVYKSYMYPDS
ncbi:MAG: tRNA 2-thiocytidine biosynthesis protein TtcA [Schwartzia sp.]|nr:tRNA 2-thiocytidine biosynthesis protein TtcA [Schwartzia sp. (in: firmicutes)]